MSTAEHQPDDARPPAPPAPHPLNHVGLSGEEAEALAVRAATVHVAHAPFPDTTTAEASAHRAFEAVLRQCACPESAVLVLRRPSGRVEALEHHHTDPTCPVVLAAGHPELETTP
ncbi:hypothetical protein ACH436_04220 [Isoptericola sp. NPDC019693]|uniref:hypothetical protein n=1 Tax=Isoptericola sp. NPDC019693 TaxID=3364009 RepID=UPI003796EE15